MRNILKTTAPILLICLFTYAGLSKLLALNDFGGELHNQSFPGWIADLILYTLIPLELLTAALLIFPRTQIRGLQLSTVLMSAFTGYIILVLLHFWERVPCSCGGILKNMSWETHLLFNLFFLILSVTTLVISKEPGAKYST